MTLICSMVVPRTVAVAWPVAPLSFCGVSCAARRTACAPSAAEAVVTARVLRLGVEVAASASTAADG